MRSVYVSSFAICAVMLAACGNPNAVAYDTQPTAPTFNYQPQIGSGSGGLVRNQRPYIAPMQGGNTSSFDGWKSAFRARALASGINESVYAQAEPYLSYRQQVVSNDKSQAEFVKPIWQYLDDAIQPRIAAGRQRAAEWGATLTTIEQRYGVDRDVVMGIWGMETNFGSFMGTTNVFTAMSTLAYEGRRRDWAEKQLINGLYIIQAGDATADKMSGSWGGGMGHTQFIPEMFNIYAVDFSGDGQRDVWYPADALASTANFLRNEGWTPGLPWGVEVRLPQGFNYAEADTANFKSASYWAGQGVQSLSSRGLLGAELAIYLPAGHRGPAFAITRNFATIKRYNPSDSYALAVALVGDTAFGLPSVQAAWPRDEQPLRRSQIVEVQRRLMAMGYNTGGADGVPGRGTREAVRRYQASVGMVPDGYLNMALYQRLVN